MSDHAERKQNVGCLSGKKDMGWKSTVIGLAFLLAFSSGCKQRCFLSKEDYLYCQDQVLTHLETKPEASTLPTRAPSRTPQTIVDPEREVRYMSLAEAVALALEQGRVGTQFVLPNGFGGAPGGSFSSIYNDQTVSFNSGASNSSVGGSDAIRVLALDPAIIGAEVENALTKFDAVWATSANWRNTDRPVGTALDSFQAGAAGVNAIEQAEARVATGVVKPLPTGGIAGITFATDYTFTNLPSRVNPSYRPNLQFQFEQPLLQGWGVEINQLRPSHPGTVLQPVGDSAVLNPGNNGILISRIRFDQQRAEFERNVNAMVANVELIYWDLYYAYWSLYAQEQGLRQAYETWKIANARYEAGRISIADREQSRGQYESFRATRMQALQDVLEVERQFRGILGLRVEDGVRIVPSDEPTLAPYNPNWETAVTEAMTLRPELVLARQEVKRQQLNVVLQKNFLLPDVRFFATYDINAIGGRLDGPDAANALRNLSTNLNNNWSMGVRMSVPIGFRAAHTDLRRARLQLARSYRVLQDSEEKIENFLALAYRRVFLNYELIRAQRAAREAFAEQLRARFFEFQAGRQNVTLDVLLEAQRNWSDALAREYSAIRDYNKTLVGFEWAKGTTLQRNNIVVSEGELPHCVKERAVEHLEERSRALQIRERPAAPIQLTACEAPPVALDVPMSPMETPSLSGLLNTTPFLQDAPELQPGSSIGTPVPQSQGYSPQPANISKTYQGIPENVQPVAATGTNFASPNLPAAPARKSKRDPRLPSEFGSFRPEDLPDEYAVPPYDKDAK